MAPSDPIRVLLVDDHPVFRMGLKALLESSSDFCVVAGVGSPSEMVVELRAHPIDVVILDLVLGDYRSLELIGQIKKIVPTTRILVVSMLDEGIYSERCLRAGASGYLMKSEAPTALVEAARRVVQGAVYLSDAMTQRLMRRVSDGAPAEAQSVEALTNREFEVFERLAAGSTTRKIAEELGISPKTVESHQGRIKTKLGVESAHELLHLAVRWRHGGTMLEP